MNKEQAIRLGIKIKPIKHSMKRRANWHDYTRRGLYMITIHIKQYEDGSYYEGTLLSKIEGDPNLMPALKEDSYHSLTGGNNDVPWPHPVLTTMGRFVDAKIQQIPLFKPFKDVRVRRYVLMPTHIHMIIEATRDLPYWAARGRNYHFGDLVRGFKQGCTSLMKMWLEGKSEEEILRFVNEQSECLQTGRKMERTFKTPPGAESEVSLWEEGYNDRNLIDEDSKKSAHVYVFKNAYYWKLVDDYPHLFEHVLHLKLADADYTAYGCMFLLGRTDRKQVMCHRLARRGMLTEREWQLATQSMEVVHAYEKNARDLGLGRFDWDWYRSSNPETITAIDYTRTEAFRKQKAELLQSCEEEDAVLVSPAVSRGEQQIVQAALDLAYPVIKLVKKPIADKGHAFDNDRDYCAKAQMLVLGPWEIKQREITNGSVQSRSVTDKDFWNGQYAKFHNLNNMAADLCVGVKEFEFDKKELEECR